MGGGWGKKWCEEWGNLEQKLYGCNLMDSELTCSSGGMRLRWKDRRASD